MFSCTCPLISYGSTGSEEKWRSFKVAIWDKTYQEHVNAAGFISQCDWFIELLQMEWHQRLIGPLVQYISSQLEPPGAQLVHVEALLRFSPDTTEPTSSALICLILTCQMFQSMNSLTYQFLTVMSQRLFALPQLKY